MVLNCVLIDTCLCSESIHSMQFHPSCDPEPFFYLEFQMILARKYGGIIKINNLFVLDSDSAEYLLNDSLQVRNKNIFVRLNIKYLILNKKIFWRIKFGQHVEAVHHRMIDWKKKTVIDLNIWEYRQRRNGSFVLCMCCTTNWGRRREVYVREVKFAVLWYIHASDLCINFHVIV